MKAIIPNLGYHVTITETQSDTVVDLMTEMIERLGEFLSQIDSTANNCRWKLDAHIGSIHNKIILKKNHLNASFHHNTDAGLTFCVSRKQLFCFSGMWALEQRTGPLNLSGPCFYNSSVNFKNHMVKCDEPVLFCFIYSLIVRESCDKSALVRDKSPARLLRESRRDRPAWKRALSTLLIRMLERCKPSLLHCNSILSRP